MTHRTSLLLALLTSLLLTSIAVPAAAQPRDTDRVAELHSGILAQLLSGQQGTVERCARRSDTGAYLAEVRVRVRAGAPPATLYNSQIAVTVHTRPRDGELEACVRREVRDALTRAPYAVGPHPVSARQTFSIADRPEPPEPRRAPPFSSGEASRVLDASRPSLQRCLEVAGVPERVTLRVAVDADGRLTLMSADLPGGVSGDALPCLARQVSRLRVQGTPARRVMVSYALAVRTHAY